MHDEDREIIEDILDNILWALDQIQKRFSVIYSPGVFLAEGSRCAYKR